MNPGPPEVVLADMLISTEDKQGEISPNLASFRYQCFRCRLYFESREGYTNIGTFFCEECAWILAENGEFYS